MHTHRPLYSLFQLGFVERSRFNCQTKLIYRRKSTRTAFRHIDDEKLTECMRSIFSMTYRGCGPSHSDLLQRTPQRAANALLYFTSGYDLSLEQVAGKALFHVNSIEDHDQDKEQEQDQDQDQDHRTKMQSTVTAKVDHNQVVVRNINFFSLCEHHMVPFYGRTVSYWIYPRRRTCPRP
jgi:GTP cyclohydrolase I